MPVKKAENSVKRASFELPLIRTATMNGQIIQANQYISIKNGPHCHHFVFIAMMSESPIAATQEHYHGKEQMETQNAVADFFHPRIQLTDYPPHPRTASRHTTFTFSVIGLPF